MNWRVADVGGRPKVRRMRSHGGLQTFMQHTVPFSAWGQSANSHAESQDRSSFNGAELLYGVCD